MEQHIPSRLKEFGRQPGHAQHPLRYRPKRLETWAISLHSGAMAWTAESSLYMLEFLFSDGARGKLEASTGNRQHINAQEETSPADGNLQIMSSQVCKVLSLKPPSYELITVNASDRRRRHGSSIIIFIGGRATIQCIESCSPSSIWPYYPQH